MNKQKINKPQASKDTRQKKAKNQQSREKTVKTPETERVKTANSEKTKTQVRTSKHPPLQKKTDSQKTKPSVRAHSKSKKTVAKTAPTAPVRVVFLGGLGEIGKNMAAIEYENDIIIIDCGMGFPDDDMLGVDLVIPDFTYLEKNKDRVKGILITHGHEDHIGAVPYLLGVVNIPVYATRLSLGIIEGKIKESSLTYKPRLVTVAAGDVIELGAFSCEFIHVNHSIADACAIAIRTPQGIIFHTGDFKLDVSPIDGFMMDLTRIGEIGKEGVTLLMCESTNSERGGYTPSERTVGSSLLRIFTQYHNKRIIIATFSSNVHRVQQIINASSLHKRKVAVLGRSMENIVAAATELGYMDVPEGVLISASEIKKYRPEEITLITTGSQGEPMSALYRIAFAEHDKVKLSADDVVILSSSAIPGNEKFVGKIVNALVKSGVKVVNDSVEEVHASGHACREEIKLMIALLKPKFYMPIHGEHRHLFANKEIAEFMGIPSANIFVSDIGKVLEIQNGTAKFGGTVPSGNVLVDGSGVGDIGSVVLRDRKHLSEDGLVVVVATVDMRGGYIVSGPDIISRGFVYVKESEELMYGAREAAETAINAALGKRARDWSQIKNNVREEVARYITRETRRKPMILTVLMEI